MLETLHPAVAARLLARLVLRRLGNFDESKHPRDDKGQWASSASGLSEQITGVHPGVTFDLQVTNQGREDAYGRRIAHIDNLVVPAGQRKQGTGSAVMEKAVTWADKHGVTLTLQTDRRDSAFSKAHGTTSKTRLTAFYRRFGFVENKGRRHDPSLSLYVSMYREPVPSRALGSIVEEDLKAAEFDEGKHPRGHDGKFTEGGEGSTSYSQHEIDTVEQYAGNQDPPEGMYVPDGLNGLLRGFSRYGGAETYTPAQESYHRQQTDQLQKIIERTPTTKDQVFYRGVEASLSEKLVDGTVFVDHGFTAITSDRRISEERFVGYGDVRGRVFEVHVPKGTPLLEIDRVLNPSRDKEYTTEREHLLGHGTRFRVKSGVLEVLR